MPKAVLAFIVLTAFLLNAQESPHKSSNEAKAANCGCAHAVSAQEAQAMRQDLEKMKAMVHQMQTNLAFVDVTQSPLKHQFQLEIELWQSLITSMERRLVGTAAPSNPSPMR